MADFSVRLKPSNKFTVTQEKTVVAEFFSDLADVDTTGIADKYLVMYNASTGKYTAVNPDTILSAATHTETIQPGLPDDFVSTLNANLDDKIDLDAGSF